MQDAWFEELRFSKTQGDPAKFLPENLSPSLLKEYRIKFSNFPSEEAFLFLMSARVS
jgi:hypothetical protein